MPSSKPGQASITVRCSTKDKEAITKKWKEYGFKSESEYIRFVALNAEIEVNIKKNGGISMKHEFLVGDDCPFCDGKLDDANHYGRDGDIIILQCTNEECWFNKVNFK